MEPTDKTTPQGPPAQAGSNTYFMIVAALLVLIFATMAVLWMRQRSVGLTLTRENAALRQENADLQKLKSAFGQALFEGGLGGATAIKPVQRDDLPSQTMSLNGQERSVLIVGSQAGERMGFRSGDLILVSQPSIAAGAKAAASSRATAATGPAGAERD